MEIKISDFEKSVEKYPELKRGCIGRRWMFCLLGTSGKMWVHYLNELKILGLRTRVGPYLG